MDGAKAMKWSEWDGGVTKNVVMFFVGSAFRDFLSGLEMWQYIELISGVAICSGS
jgi:hypothetical protein